MARPTKPTASTAVVPADSRYRDITAPDTTRHDGWTRERMIAFLEALVETASVSVAAQSVGMARRSAYYLRARLMGQPFDLAWEAALEFGLQQLHNEALDRAMNGVPVPIYYGGEQVGERRHYNETLTRFLLDNPNARAKARHDPVVRAAALAEWTATMKRVQTGPIVWTPTETKKAQGLADEMHRALKPPSRPASRASAEGPTTTLTQTFRRQITSISCAKGDASHSENFENFGRARRPLRQPRPTPIRPHGCRSPA